jgi:hypothetical protein
VADRVRLAGLSIWALCGAWCGCKAALITPHSAAYVATPSNFEAYHRYVGQQQQRAPSVPETSPSADYILSLPRVAMPYIPRAYYSPNSKTQKTAGKRGTLTKSSRLSRTTQRSRPAPRSSVVRSSKGRIGKAVLNYGVSGYGVIH